MTIRSCGDFLEQLVRFESLLPNVVTSPILGMDRLDERNSFPRSSAEQWQHSWLHCASRGTHQSDWHLCSHLPHLVLLFGVASRWLLILIKEEKVKYMAIGWYPFLLNTEHWLHGSVWNIGVTVFSLCFWVSMMNPVSYQVLMIVQSVCS